MAAPWPRIVGTAVDFLVVLGVWCAVSFAAAPVLGKVIGGKRRDAVRSEYHQHQQSPQEEPGG